MRKNDRRTTEELLSCDENIEVQLAREVSTNVQNSEQCPLHTSEKEFILSSFQLKFIDQRSFSFERSYQRSYSHEAKEPSSTGVAMWTEHL